jgi:Fe-S cluster assembly iron-binding protein IscA
MAIDITDKAAEKLKEAISGSELKMPALKIVFAGYG